MQSNLAYGQTDPLIVTEIELTSKGQERATQIATGYLTTLKSGVDAQGVELTDAGRRTLALLLPEALAKAGWSLTSAQVRALGIQDLPTRRPPAHYTVEGHRLGVIPRVA